MAEQNSQLNDNGLVIGYKPKLEYVPKKTTVTEEPNDISSSVTTKSKETFSNALTGISKNLPSDALDDIEFVVDNLENLIQSLANNFIDNKTEKFNKISNLLNAFSNGDLEYINDFVDYHFALPSSSINPELMKDIYLTKIRLEELSKTLKYLYYGDDHITLENAAIQDKAKIDLLKSYESARTSKYINYMTISCDATLNRSISSYVYEANRHCMNLAEVINKPETIIADITKKNLIEKMFEEVNDEISYRQTAYDAQQSIEVMNKTLYNYYNKRSDFNELYDLFSSNYSEKFALNSKIEEYQNQIELSLINVNRSFVGNQIHLSELTNLETEKAQLMKIYSDLSYNS